MKRTLNLRILAYLAGAAIVLIPGIHFLHAFQVKRNAGIFLDQAEKAQQDGELHKAAGYYRRYLDLDPLDRHRALAKYGELLADERLAKSGKAKAQAYFKLEQALRREPERHDVRKLVIRLAMDPMLHRHGEALEELKILDAALGEDAERLRLQGFCHTALRQYKDARKALEKSLTLAADGSDDFEAFLGLATLLRDKGAEVIAGEKDLKEVYQKADATIVAMLVKFGGSHRARLGAAHYYQRFAAQLALEIGAEKTKTLADDQVLEAHKLAPDQLEAILAYAALKQAARKSEAEATAEARAELQRGLGLHPKERLLYQALAHLEMLDGKPEAALTTLRQGLKELPNDLIIVWNLALLYTHQGQENEAREQMATLQKAGFPPTELEYLEARIEANKRHWHAAARLLEKIYPLLAARVDQKRDWLKSLGLDYQSNLLLALCYERMGDPYAASSVYARAVERFPQHNVFRLGLARMEWNLGRFDNALREYTVLMSSPQSPVQAWVESLQLQIDRTLRQPQREWSAIERKLDQVEKLKIAPVEIALLRAEVLAAKKDHDGARKVLEGAHADAKSRPAEVWIGLAGLEQQRGKADLALALLDEADRALGERVELRQARCRYWARRGGAEAARALDQIQVGLDKLTPEHQERLLSTLASSYLRIAETGRAKDTWQQIAKRAPTNLRSRMALFDLALQDNDQAAMSAHVAAMRDEIEGAEGTLWRYCRASQIIAAAKKDGELRPLKEAGELLSVVAKRRPTWGRVLVAQGLVNDLIGNYDVAIERYQRAMALGEESVSIIERTVRLLRSQSRLAEVDELIQRLPALAKGTYGELDRIGAESALRAYDLPKAMSLAARATPEDSKDYRDKLWLGDFKWAAGKRLQAEEDYRQAIKLAPDVPATWTALVSHFVRCGEKGKAIEVVEEMQKALPKNRVHLALAWELAGQSIRSKELFDAALSAAPNDRDVLRGMAFAALRKRDLAEAKKLLEKLITLTDSTPAKLAEDKRLLAVVLGLNRDYQETVKALRLLGVFDVDAAQLPTVAGESVADQRAKIAILARAQNPRQRRQAIGLLEGLIRRQQITPDERFLLAQLYDSVGEWPKAKQQHQIVLTTAPAATGTSERAKAAWQRSHAEHLTAYCVSLLRNDAAGEVEPWLAKLEALEPKSFRSIGLRAQLLHRQGYGEKAVPELLALEKSQEKLTGSVGALLEQIGQVKLAEDMFKKLAGQTMKPETNLMLAQFYGRQGRTDEALALCQSALKTGSIEPVAAAAVVILYTGKANSDQCQKVAGWLQSALVQNEKATTMMNHLAAVRRLQKDHAGAAALFRRVLQQDANDIITLNNLAWLLALSGGDVSEAQSMIKRAIELDGPVAELLDTRGVCHLKSGNAEAAIKDFQEAITEAATSQRYFHLAQAHYLAKNRSAAHDAYQRAVRLKLSEDVIDPLELPAYHQLRAEFGVKTTAAR